VLIEQALVLTREMPHKLQSCLLANIACFYERQGDLKAAKLYQKNSFEVSAKGDDPQAAVNMAINFNNLSVMELRAQNYDGALAAAKQAFGFVEQELLT
jgi:hypothetical protein